MEEVSKTINFVQNSLSLKNNNSSKDNSYIRETFLESVSDHFFHQVTTNNKIVEQIQNCNLLEQETINALINQIIIEMELGLVPEKEELSYENMLIILTLATKDYPKKLVRKRMTTNKCHYQKFDKKKNI